jgi:LuxR family maltose regulon positive regulatory protein
LVKRRRLIVRLKEGLKYNLILISAPAGFGKTTLLSEWARQSQPSIHTAWVSLDEADNDPVRFWDYFIASLQTLQPDAGVKSLALLHSTQAFSGRIPPIESVLTLLINDLAATPGNVIIVLDDYQLIDSQQIHGGITYLLEHMPLQIHLVIATRADPPLTLARFRGRGAMFEMGADDLRFSLGETASLLKEMNAPELSSENIKALNDRAEGWVVGLKMAALSMSGQKDIPGFIAAFTGSQRYVMDYLMEEVLQKLTLEIRDFLLKTSVLERLSGHLCDAVTGRKGSQDVLLNLERSHLFIVPLDETRQWYRYEHLFADLLRHQAQKMYRMKDIIELHRRASRWYEGNHFTNDVITHALAARDWGRVAGIIENIGRDRANRGEWVTMLNWLRLLPEDVLQAHLQLYIWYCLALAITGQLDTAESKLRKIEMVARGGAIIQGEIAAAQSFVYQVLGDIPRTIEMGKKALSLLPGDESESRCMVCYTLGYMYWKRGLFTEARPLLTEAHRVGRQLGNLGVAANSLIFLAEMDRYGGKLRRAAEQLQQAIELAGTSPAAAPSHESWGAVLGEWNQLEAAVYHMQKAIELGQLSCTPEFVARSIILLAYLRLAQGNEAEAMKALEKSCSIAHNLGSPSARADHAAFHIMIALMQNDLVTASEWGSQLALNADALPFYINLIPARLLIAQGKKIAAAEKLRSLYDETLRGGLQSYTIRIRLYQTMAADHEESALDFLMDALVMAEPEGYIRTFVDEGKLVGPLLKKVILKGICHEYAARLLDIIQKEQQGDTATRKDAILSRRELEVLRFLAEGLTSQQICQRLIVSPNTAKTHIRHILEKLNSRGRLQAVARARELKLIS